MIGVAWLPFQHILIFFVFLKQIYVWWFVKYIDQIRNKQSDEYTTIDGILNENIYQ